MGTKELLAFVGQFSDRDAVDRSLGYDQYLEQYTRQIGPITAEEYAAIERDNQVMAREGIDQLLEKYDLDVIVSDVVQAYAPAGYPALTEPARYGADGTPQGAVFVGGYLSEPQLLAVGYAYEQATRARVAPDLEATMQLIENATPEENEMITSQKPKTDPDKPEYVTDLETAYGAPSQEGFGSAVFYEKLKATDDLKDAALAKYKYFTGELWERWGENAWMGPWKEVYARKAGARPDIVAELRGITDDDASISTPMILDSVSEAEKARAALAAAYDDPAVTELRVYNLGDGGAMSGLLVAGRRGETGETTFLVFLYD